MLEPAPPLAHLTSPPPAGMADPQLCAAVNVGDSVALEAALAAGADPNRVVHESGYTVLHDVCYTGHLACVRVLLAAGADPNAATSSRNTPLQFAAKCGHTQCIRALLAAGANPAAVDPIGWTLCQELSATTMSSPPGPCWRLPQSLPC